MSKDWILDAGLEELALHLADEGDIPMRSIFGWDLPPGCTPNDIETAMGGDEEEAVIVLTKQQQINNVYATYQNYMRLSEQGRITVEELDAQFALYQKSLEAIGEARNEEPAEVPLIHPETQVQIQGAWKNVDAFFSQGFFKGEDIWVSSLNGHRQKAVYSHKELNGYATVEVIEPDETRTLDQVSHARISVRLDD